MVRPPWLRASTICSGPRTSKRLLPDPSSPLPPLINDPLPMNLCRCRLGDALANAREHLIPGGAFGHRLDLSPGPRHGGPTIPSGLIKQHLNPFTIDLEFGDLSHCSLSCAYFSKDWSHGRASERGFRPPGS